MDDTLKTVLTLFIGGLLSLSTGIVSSILIHTLTLRRELTLSAHKARWEAQDKAQEEYKAAIAATLEWASTLGRIVTPMLLLVRMSQKEKWSVGEVRPFLHEAILPASDKMPRPPQHQLALLKSELYEPLDNAQGNLTALYIQTTTEKRMPSITEIESRLQDAFDQVGIVSEKLQKEYRLQVPSIEG